MIIGFTKARLCFHRLHHHRFNSSIPKELSDSILIKNSSEKCRTSHSKPLMESFLNEYADYGLELY